MEMEMELHAMDAISASSGSSFNARNMDDVAGRMEVLGMVHAFVTPFVLRAAVNLGIFDIIAASSTPLTAEQIMSRIPNAKNPQVGILTRILRFLLQKRLLQVTVKEGNLLYGLTRMSKWLLSSSDNKDSLAPLLVMEMNDKCQAAWQVLDDVVLHGGDAFERANGKFFWEYGVEDSRFNRVVNEAMISFSNTTMSIFLQCYDGFWGLNTVVDVGGGMGHAIAKIVEAHPQITGINYDLPHVVATAPKIPGVEHVSGSMFDSVPEADAIFIKSVLHNWDDEHCIKLLENCQKALPENGKLIILDIVFNPARRNKFSNLAAEQDMIMLAYTTGGKERTQEEWETLLTSCGFSGIRFDHHMPTKESVIEAYKFKHAKL